METVVLEKPEVAEMSPAPDEIAGQPSPESMSEPAKSSTKSTVGATAANVCGDCSACPAAPGCPLLALRSPTFELKVSGQNPNVLGDLSSGRREILIAETVINDPDFAPNDQGATFLNLFDELRSAQQSKPPESKKNSKLEPESKAITVPNLDQTSGISSSIIPTDNREVVTKSSTAQNHLSPEETEDSAAIQIAPTNPEPETNATESIAPAEPKTNSTNLVASSSTENSQVESIDLEKLQLESHKSLKSEEPKTQDISTKPELPKKPTKSLPLSSEAVAPDLPIVAKIETEKSNTFAELPIAESKPEPSRKAKNKSIEQPVDQVAKTQFATKNPQTKKLPVLDLTTRKQNSIEKKPLPLADDKGPILPMIDRKTKTQNDDILSYPKNTEQQKKQDCAVLSPIISSRIINEQFERKGAEKSRIIEVPDEHVISEASHETLIKKEIPIVRDQKDLYSVEDFDDSEIIITKDEPEISVTPENESAKDIVMPTDEFDSSEESAIYISELDEKKSGPQSTLSEALEWSEAEVVELRASAATLDTAETAEMLNDSDEANPALAQQRKASTKRRTLALVGSRLRNVIAKLSSKVLRLCDVDGGRDFEYNAFGLFK